MTQPDRNPAVPHELLLGQAGFLRRLARDLVRDPHAAEDALQDAWVAALEHPPRHDGNVRAWLGTILKNLVARRAQASDRRTHHERRAAREGDGSTIPNPSGESVRFVTDAVLALEEPYQSTILARYFEDLTPSEIAKRQSVPVSTVKSRLQRALEMLRVRMQRDRGSSWASGLIGLAWPAAASHSIPITVASKGVLAMTMKTKIAAAAALVFAAWFLMHEMTSLPTSPRESGSHSLEVPALAGAGPDSARPLNVEGAPPARSPDTSGLGASAAAPGDRPPTLLYGSLRDRSGKLLAGLWSEGVSLTDSTGRWRSADAADGTFAFGALPYGQYWVQVGADGYRDIKERIELDAAHAQIKRDYTLQEAVELRIRVVTTDGEAWFDRQHGTKIPGYPVLTPIATKERPGRWFPRKPIGTGHFADYGPRVEALPPGYYGILTSDVELPAFVSLVSSELVLETKEVKPGETEVVFVVSLEELRGLLAEVRLKVVDADSEAPILGGSLQVGPHCQLRREGPESEVVLTGLCAGDFDWGVRAPGYEEVFVRFHAEPGARIDLGTVALEKELHVEAKVVDETGSPRCDCFDLLGFDPLTRELHLLNQGISPNAQGRLQLEGLGRRVYLLRSCEYALLGDRVATDLIRASANVLIDLRSGSAPTNLTVRLQPVTRLTFTTGDPSIEGLPLQILDEQAIPIFANLAYGPQPRSVALPQGNYRIEVLDRAGKPLISKAMTLGAAAISVELSR